ncbi:MAG: hypothetical protein KKB50_16745 [Planctomycetes bacterium]|nr:hypothetical protein [Planctomycetota bacterium]
MIAPCVHHLLLLLSIAACLAPAPADVVKLVDRPAFRRVAITNMKGARLIFRGVSGQYLREPLAEVEWIEIDRVEPLGRAEHAAAAQQWEQAVAAYEQALEQAGPTWLRELISVRLVRASDQAGRFTDAVGLYVELLSTQPELAGSHVPRNPGPPGSRVNGAARERLAEAIGLAGNPQVRAACRALLLEMQLYDEVFAELPEVRRQAEGGQRLISRLNETSPASRPAGGAGLANAGVADGRPGRNPDLRARGGSDSALLLPLESIVLVAARKALAQGDAGRAGRLAEHAWPYVTARERDEWRIVLGRCRIEQGRPAEAAADLVNLAESTRNRAQAAEALYYVGLAHERLGRTDVATALYRELAAGADVPELWKAQARASLRRIGE